MDWNRLFNARERVGSATKGEESRVSTVVSLRVADMAVDPMSEPAVEVSKSNTVTVALLYFGTQPLRVVISVSKALNVAILPEIFNNSIR